MALMNACTFPGCVNLFKESGNRCIKHKRVVDKQKQEQLFARDKQSRDDHRFYNSAQWKRIRKLKLSNNPLCEQCGAIARIVDHIKRLREGGSRYAMGNLQSLCDECHQQKRGQEAHRKR